VAELELSLRYKTLPAKVGLGVMGVLFPVWALVLPFCLGLFISLLIQAAAAIPPLVAAAVLLGLILLPMLGVLMTAVCEDDRILVSKEGIAFPLFMLPGLGYRRERVWSDLAQAQIQWSRGPKLKSGDKLILYFKSGGRAVCGLTDISKSDVEQMLLAIEIWGSGCERQPELIEFQNTVQNENKGLETLSYTQMWEEELSRRFNATSFVPLEPGHVLQGGRLKVVRQLAFGGLSAIYLVQREGLDLVCLKEAVIPASADEDSRLKAVEMFNREAALLIKLNHPQIAKVLDHFDDGGRNYLLIEYINGQDLRQLVKQHGPQAEETVLRWGLQVAEILAYLHDRSVPIIHRDVTPDNLVVRDDGTLTMIDFGAANEFVGTATGTLVGKQSYIAPEQFRCKATTQSDIYALGGTMYYLVTGRDPEALMESHPKEVNAEISDAADALIAKCTMLDVTQRYARASDVHAAISEVLDAAHAPAASISAQG
jgi:predicted Ser/Thr protein kinase